MPLADVVERREGGRRRRDIETPGTSDCANGHGDRAWCVGAETNDQRMIEEEPDRRTTAKEAVGMAPCSTMTQTPAGHRVPNSRQDGLHRRAPAIGRVADPCSAHAPGKQGAGRLRRHSGPA